MEVVRVETKQRRAKADNLHAAQMFYRLQRRPRTTSSGETKNEVPAMGCDDENEQTVKRRRTSLPVSFQWDILMN